MFEFTLFEDDDSPEWEEIKQLVFQRDDYTCQRCFHQSGPHAGKEGRILHPHHVNPQSEGGEDTLENLVTLCKPCHGVQHPDNEGFVDHRPHAPLLPNESADDRVAFVNSAVKNETYHEFKNRMGNECVRCGESDPLDLYFVPLVDDSVDSWDNPLEAYELLCSDCLAFVVLSGSRSTSWFRRHVIPYDTPRKLADITTLVESASDPRKLSNHPHPDLQLDCQSWESSLKCMICRLGGWRLYSFVYQAITR